MEPITRQEQLLDSIATGNSVELEPITREEQYLSAIAGLTDFIPEKPITRKEMFYEKILESGGAGGDGTAKPTQTKTINVVENGTYKVTPDSGKVLSSVTAKVNVPERYDEGFAEGKDQGLSEGYSSGFGAGVNSVKLQEKTVTENGDVLPDEGFSGMSKVTVDVPTSGSGKEEQEKTVTITENGTTEVTPDEGKTLSKVTVETNVSQTLNPPVTGFVPTAWLHTPNLDQQNGCVTEGDYYGEVVAQQAFYSSNRLAPFGWLKTINFKGNVKRVGINAFYGCGNLLLDKLPESLESLGDYAFRSCRKVTFSRIPPKITTLGTGVFQGCISLTTMTLHSQITSIGSSLFEDCDELEQVVFEGVLTSDMKTSSFKNCTALTNLTIGEGWAVSIYLTYSPNLTVESLHGMIENLADLTGATAKTFSVGETNLAKIDEEHIAMLQAKNWNYS